MDRYLVIAGRILMSVIFILSGFGKITGFHGTESMMASKEIPAPAIALVVVIIIELGGGLLLLLGLWPRWIALLLFLYLIPVTLTMHNFWAAPAAQQQMQQINFLKNLAIMGGLLAFHAREGRTPGTRRLP
jgi:putative oxidoreductase